MWQALFLNGDCRNPQVLADLARACERIYSADGGLEHARRLGFKPHCHFGDDDSLSPQGLAYLKSEAIPRLHYPEYKDEPDSALAFHYILEQGTLSSGFTSAASCCSGPGRDVLLNSQATAEGGDLSNFLANISPDGLLLLAALGERYDHVLANLSLCERFVRSDFPILVSDGQSFIWTFKGPFAASFPHRFSKFLPQDTAYFSLLSLSEEIEGLSLKGSTWELEKRKLFAGINLGISNEWAENSEVIALRFQTGKLQLVFSFEDKARSRELWQEK